ncbi:hypothetical protein AB0K60_16800 [Thermopolyspora sp. NPDC052614]|uniref:hypothetical protein n=1 Tax=Thermopolyspora sp. NPDC052614 TaxID=3155682 RepID=UPI0034402C2F
MQEGRRFRLINVGRDSYTSDANYARLPEGKVWIHWRDVDGFVWTKDLIDAINPKFLKIAASGEVISSPGGMVGGAATSLYSGAFSVAQLETKSMGTAFSLKKTSWAGGRIEWKIWAGPDGLPRRFYVIIRFNVPAGRSRTIVADTSCMAWGKSVDISPPPASRTVDSHELRHG